MNARSTKLCSLLTPLIDCAWWNKCNGKGKRLIFPMRYYTKSSSSNRWLRRQHDDPYVKKALETGYRSRSAFKLIEMHKKFKIFHKGDVVIDVGASPGSWTQVAVEKIGPSGLVIAVDLRSMKPIDDKTIIMDHMDFEVASTQSLIENNLAGRKANVIMSDMSPNVAGSPKLDHHRIVNLALSALKFTLANLVGNGTFICKLFHGADEKEFKNILSQNYRKINAFKPSASRSASNEFYYICRYLKYNRKENSKNQSNATTVV